MTGPGVARIATICLNSRTGRTLSANRSGMLELIDRTCKNSPDVVCLPEAFSSAGIPSTPAGPVLDTCPGPTINAVSQKAKRNGCYIICPVVCRRKGKIRNSAFVIDRKGKVVGVYDKVHPVTKSSDYACFEDGVFPGEDLPVFDLDFGRVGIHICFDAGFPESWAGLAKKGARLIFWPSAYTGGFPLQAYASLHQCHVVSSVRSNESRIINPCGRIVAKSGARTGVAVHDLNLDFSVCHYDFNFGIPARIAKAYGNRVRVSTYREDALFLVEPLDGKLTTKQLQKEFGFECAHTYFERHKKAYRQLLGGKKPLPQKAAHGDRAQYGEG